jgi:hypothetical protein
MKPDALMLQFWPTVYGSFCGLKPLPLIQSCKFALYSHKFANGKLPRDTLVESYSGSGSGIGRGGSVV